MGRFVTVIYLNICFLKMCFGNDENDMLLSLLWALERRCSHKPLLRETVLIQYFVFIYFGNSAAIANAFLAFCDKLK